MLTYDELLRAYRKNNNTGDEGYPERAARQSIVNMYGSPEDYKKKLSEFRKQEKKEAVKSDYSRIVEEFESAREPLNYSAIVDFEILKQKMIAGGHSPQKASLQAEREIRKKYGNTLYSYSIEPNHQAQIDELSKLFNISNGHKARVSGYMKVYGLDAWAALRRLCEEMKANTAQQDERYEALPWEERLAYQSLTEAERKEAELLIEHQPDSGWSYGRYFHSIGGDGSSTNEVLEEVTEIENENE